MDSFKFNPAFPKPTEPGNYLTFYKDVTPGFIEEVYFDGVSFRYRDSLNQCYLQDRQWIPVEVLA